MNIWICCDFSFEHFVSRCFCFFFFLVLNLTSLVKADFMNWDISVQYLLFCKMLCLMSTGICLIFLQILLPVFLWDLENLLCCVSHYVPEAVLLSTYSCVSNCAGWVWITDFYFFLLQCSDINTFYRSSLA